MYLYCFRLVNGQLRLCETWLSRYTLVSMCVRCGERYTRSHASTSHTQRKIEHRNESLLFMFVSFLTKLRNKCCCCFFSSSSFCFSMFDNCILLCVYFFYLKRPQLIGQMLKLKFNQDNENKTPQQWQRTATTSSEINLLKSILHMCVPFDLFKIDFITFLGGTHSIIVLKLFLMKTLLLAFIS